MVVLIVSIVVVWEDFVTLATTFSEGRWWQAIDAHDRDPYSVGLKDKGYELIDDRPCDIAS